MGKAAQACAKQGWWPVVLTQKPFIKTSFVAEGFKAVVGFLGRGMVGKACW